MTKNNINIGVAGEYRLLIKKGGEVVKDTGWFHNLITNTGIFRICNVPGGGFTQWDFAVGSGSTPPDYGDTSLVYQIGIPTPASSYFPAPTYDIQTDVSGNYREVVLEGNFAKGDIVGNITEIGFYCDFGGGYPRALMSRALVLDAGGNPTSITVTADEQLYISYKVKTYYSQVKKTGVISDQAGGNYTWESFPTFPAIFSDAAYSIRPYDNSTFEAFYGDVSIGESGYYLSGSNGSTGTYTNVSTVTDNIVTTTITMDLATANNALGIGGIQGNGAAIPKITFTPPLPKDDTKTLELKFTYTVTRME